METADQSIRIDLDAVLRSRMPRYYRYIPRFIVRWLSGVICQEEMNEMLTACQGKRDAEFCRGVLSHLDISYDVVGEENADKTDRRVIIACNHPLGGLDGMMLIDYVTGLYGGRPVKFVVNDLLMAIEPLSGVFLPINKLGHQSRLSSRAIEEAMAGAEPVIIFPAGLVSRKGAGGQIADLQWQKSFVNKAIQYHRNVVPMFFSGRNSNFFYNFAKLRTRLGLKLNIEMARLPKEVFRSKGCNYTIHVGKPISWESLNGGRDAQSSADEIRKIVYGLPKFADSSTIESI